MSNIRMGSFFTTAMEDIADGSVEETEEGMFPEMPDDIILVNSSDAISENTDSLNDLVADTSVLETTLEIVDTTESAGVPITETAALATEELLKTFNSKWGLPINNMPAIESYDASDRLMATKLALESVKGSILAAWQSVKDFFVKMWDFIADFIKDFFNANESLRATVLEMSNRIKNLTNTEPKKTEFDNSIVSRAFAYEQTITINVVKKVLTTHIEHTKQCIEKYDELYGLVEKIESEELKDISKPSDERIEKGGLLTIKELSGAKLAYGTIITVSTNADQTEVIFKQDTTKLGSKATCMTLDPGEMGDVLESIIDLVDANKEFKTQETKINRLSEQLKKATDIAINAIKSEQTNTNGAKKGNKIVNTRLKGIRKSLISVGTVYNKITVIIPKINVGAGRAALTYVGASYKQYVLGPSKNDDRSFDEKTGSD